MCGDFVAQLKTEKISLRVLPIPATSPSTTLDPASAGGPLTR